MDAPKRWRYSDVRMYRAWDVLLWDVLLHDVSSRHGTFELRVGPYVAAPFSDQETLGGTENVQVTQNGKCKTHQSRKVSKRKGESMECKQINIGVYVQKMYAVVP
jgi:hypothetical protein